jgi:drug/metabolite transporter (DMT)-like permease
MMGSKPLAALAAETSVAPSKSSARPNRIAVTLAFLAIYVVWGSTYLAIRYAVETIPPLYTAGLRHLVAGSLLLAWCLMRGLRPSTEQIRASVAIGFFFFLLGHGSLHWAETRVPSGLASLLIATEPIFVFLMTAAANRRWRMNATLFGGIAAGLGGVALLMGRSGLGAGSGVFWGGMAILVGAISWSVGIIYSRRSHLSGSPLLLSALSLLTGSVMLLTAGSVAGEWRGFAVSKVTHRSWAALAYLIVFGSIVAFTAYNWLLEHYSPTLVATHTYVNPIVAVILGWWMAGEAITLNLALSALLVIVAVILVDRGMGQLGEESQAKMA